MRNARILMLIIVLLIFSAATLWFLSIDKNHMALIAVEGAVCICILLLIIFYRNIIRPMRILTTGINLLREQDFSSRLTHTGQHEADSIAEMFNSMMMTLREERLKIREQNHFLDLLIDVSPMGILILDNRDHILTANRAAASFLEYSATESLHGIKIDELTSQLGEMLSRLGNDEVTTMRLADSMVYRCSRLSFMDKGYRHPFILIEKMTEEVMMAEKKSYERVIRTIAHEINNSMGSVRSMLDTVISVSDGETDDALTETLRVCEKRCSSLSSFITSYANAVKIPEISPVTTDLNTYLSHLHIILESICTKGNVRFRFEPDDNHIQVSIDPVLFEQVIINIVKNSVESIGSAENGIVTLTVKAAPRPSLIITDNGQGITPETSAKLFNPFFSTKPGGQGIGLMLISDVLHKHGCQFSLRTYPDRLTRFAISFPS